MAFTTAKNSIISSPCYANGSLISQPITFSGPKTISKASLYLKLIEEQAKSYIELDANNIASFPAANFQETSDTQAWSLYDDPSSFVVAGEETCNQGYLTNRFDSDLTEAQDVLLSSPSVTYNVLLSPGEYDVWIRAWGSGTLFHGWNQTEQLASTTIDATTTWKQIGTLSIAEESVNALALYVGQATAQGLKIDQFCIRSIEQPSLSGTDDPLVNASGPFNIFVRVRELTSGLVTSPPSGIKVGCWSWLSSNLIKGNGWYNFIIRDTVFSEGLCIDFTVISGSSEFNAQWVYGESGSTQQTGSISNDWGITFE